MPINMQITEYIGSIVECVISIKFLTEFFGYKKIKHKYLITVAAILLLCVDNILFSQKEGFETLSIAFLILILLVFSLVSLKGSVYLKIVISIVVPMVIMIINMSTLYIFSTIADIEMASLYASDHGARLLLLFITKFIYFLVTKKGSEFMHFQEKEMGKMEWVGILILFFLSFGMMMVFWTETRDTPKVSGYLFISILISVSAMNILFYWLMKKIHQLNGEKIELALSTVAYQTRLETVDIMKEQYEEILGIRHDMKNYLQCASTLLQQGKVKEAENYLNTISEDSLQNIELQVLTNNEIVDAILNTKIQACRKQGITVDYKMEGNCVNIDNKDASILIANLFDNAIEANRKVEDGLIQCKIDRYKKYLRIVFENRINESVLENNPNLKTTKTDKKKHGYGMKTIRKIVEKYNGMLNLSEEGDLFKVEILLMQ